MATPLRLLVVSSYYYPAMVYGGPINSIHHRNKALSHYEHHVVTYTTNANGVSDLEVPTGGPLLVDGLPVTYFPRWWFGRARKPANLFFSPALGAALQALKPGDFDLMLLHASFCDPGRLAAKAARRTGIPYIYYTHGGFEPWAFNHKHWKKKIYLDLIENRILYGAAGIVVCNDAEAVQLHHLGVKTPSGRIPWGVDLPDPGNLPTRQRLEEFFPHLRDRPFCLFLSRLHAKKGLDILIPALQRSAQEFPDWLLVLAGPDEGGYRIQLEKMVRDLGLKNRVIFPGMVTGEVKAALLAHADLFVLPSYSEGFPVAVAEALGYGRPVVITTSSYIPEVAEAGAGLVVPPETQALTTALGKMMRDEALRNKCALNAIKLVKGHFTWDAVANQTLDFYRDVIQ